MQSIQKINVDISRDRNLSEPSVYAKQNDSNSRKVEVTLFDSGVQLSSLTAPGKVFFGKGNNSYFEKIEITNGVTEFIIPQNALSSSGRIQAEILILNDTDTEALTSATFIINCHAQINPSGAITGENNGDILGQILERIEQIQASNMSRTPLPDGAIDLNTFITSGWWYTTEQRIDITNTPKDLAELELIVTKDVLSITQILIACDGGYGICYRFSHNSGKNWTDWRKFATDADVSTTNLVNGSAEGSLRGIDARAENDDYTMGECAVALGYDTTASGIYSHAEGDHTAASGNRAHAEGNSTLASGDSSHAEGIETRATGKYSHAEGFDTRAENRGAHAEGVDTIANGSQSHAEGKAVKAYGDFSHAEGSNTIASGYCQHAQGKFNIADNDNKYLHIVGNGEDEENRSNAHTLDWDGNAWFAGDVYVGGTSQDDANATKLSSVAEKLKNHTSFSVLTNDANAKTYIKLGKFTGDGAGGRAIFTINGKVGWNNKNDGGLKVLTLSSNDSRDATSTDIFTGGSFFDFGHSDNDGTSIIEDTPDIQVAIVRPSDYTVKEVDIYLKFAQNKYNSYLITVDYSGTCKWETDVKPVNATDPDPMETALSAFVVPKKRFADVENLEKKVNLTNGTIQGAVDWNTITKTGCYKIQNCTMTADYNAPVDEYVYGVLQVLNSENETGEYRVTQIYMPRSPQRYSLWIRTNNSTTGYNNWTDWIPFNNAFQLYTKFSTKADIESGTCTLSASNGTVSNATYSVVGNMVTLNFNIAPTGAGNVVVSGLPFTATKNQSGFASSTATYNITANQTSVSINSTSGTAEYCTVTYLK